MANITWTGNAGDGNFNNPLNWSPQQIPGAADTVNIAPAAAVAIGLANDAVAALTTNHFVTLNLSNQSTFTIGTAAAGATTFANGGVFNISSTNQNTDFIVGATSLTLTGGGTIALDDNGANRIYGAAAGDVLNNANNLIEGAGQLGVGQLSFTNGASGTVNANLSNQLVLNTGSNVVSNSGLLESTGGGGLVIHGTTVNNGSAGRVSGAGGIVILQGATLQGGTLSSSGQGAIVVQAGNSGTLDGTANTVTNTGSVDINNQGTLSAFGTIFNSGTIALQSSNQTTDLIVGAAGLTLTGNGHVTLSDNGSNRIYGAAAKDVLTNLNNTISGGGQLGAGQLSFTNSAAGTVNANVGSALVLNTGAKAVTNNGLLESTGSGGLVIAGTKVNNAAKGLVSAAGGNVFLQGATLEGGTLTSSGGAAITIQSTQSATLDGTAHKVTNLGLVSVQNQATLSLLGTLNNMGTISLGSSNQPTDLLIGPTGKTPGTVTLTGGGVVTLSNNPANFIVGSIAGDTLVNLNNTISGAGHIGSATQQLVLINDATIDANDPNALIVQTDGGAVTNNSLLESTSSGGLVINSTTISNASGTVLAAGGNVYLQSATIAGGLLSSSGGGAIVVQSGQTGTLDSSAHVVTNTGIIDVNNQGTLAVLGSIVNDGTIALQSSNQPTTLLIESSTFTLTGNGSGTVTLTDNASNAIEGAAATDVLDNVNNVIEGSGQLGNGSMGLINGAAGIINATGAASRLFLNTGALAASNSGLIEATGSAGLQISSAVNNGTAGTIEANGATAVVYLDGGTLAGGTLVTANGGLFRVEAGNTGTLDGSTNAVTNQGNLIVNNQATLSVLGSLINQNVITLGSSNQNTDLIISSPTLTLTGGGTIALSNNAGNRIYGVSAASVLDNINNTITGAGQLGNGTLTLINAAAGIIDASADGAALVIDTAGKTVTNAGLIEATGAGGLVVQSTTIDSSSGGTILADGANVFLNGSTLAGGTINSSGTGAIFINGGQTATLDGSVHTLTNLGTVNVQNGGSLSLLGTIANIGALNINSSNQPTGLLIGPAGATAGTVTLTGNGFVTLSNNASNYILGSIAGDTLVNLNNTISGAGHLGSATQQLVLINDATIDANDATALVVQTDGGAVTNNGLMEATGSGGLVINSSTISNASGTVLAAGGNVYLQAGSIAGGLVSSSGGGAIVVQGGQSGTLDGSAATLTNAGVVAVNNQGTLSLLGTIVNSGSIALQSSNQNTDFVVGTPTLTLTGGGTVTLSSNAGNRIYGAVGTDVLNNVNNLIEGAGQLGAGQLTLVNGVAGVIDASTGTALVVNTGASVTTNNGLMESTSSGGLVIQGVVNSGSAGVISAAGGNVFLQSGTLQGGTLTSSGGGAFIVQGGQVGTLDGTAHALTTTGAVDINNQGTLTLLGTIVNSGTIALQSSNQNTDLIVASSTVTLSGGGTVTLSDNPANIITGAAVGDVLDNVNNTIAGAGQLGGGQMTLINGGIIEAVGGNALHINLGSTGRNLAGGQMLGVGSGGLSIENGTYTNLGLIQADDGSRVTFQAGATLTNSANGTLTGGAYGAIDGGHGATLNVTGSAIAVDAADIILSGAGSSITFGGTAIDTSLDAIAAGGTLAVLGGRNFTVVANSGSFTENGVLSLGGGTFTTAKISVGSGATVSGNGTITGPVTDSGTLAAIGGNLVFTGALGNSANGTLTGGTYSAGAGSTLSLTGGAIKLDAAHLILSGAGSEITFGGTAIENSLTTIAKGAALQILGGRNYTTTQKLTNSGTLALGGGVLTAKALNDKGTSVLTGFGTLATNLTSGSSIVATGGTLELNGKTNTLSGTMSGTGTLAFGGTTDLGAGSQLKVSHIAMISKATLNIDTPLSFAGTFDIEGKATIAGSGAFTSTGLFAQTGAGLATISDAFTNNGTIQIGAGGTLAFSGGLANTGLILDSGAFTDTASLTGGALTVGAHGTSAVIASGSGSGNSTLSTLTVGGGTLNTSGTTLTVTGDYNNTAAGVGNAYNAFAGVTGTIDGHGTQLGVIGVNGTTITTVNGTLTITIAAGGTASFEIENTGAAGSAALRGALQTTVNGGHITGKALSGSGVTAQDFGPILAGGASGVFTIAYSSGALNGQAIHIASDFANVAGLTIDIVSGQAPLDSRAPAYFGGHTWSDRVPESAAWVHGVVHAAA